MRVVHVVVTDAFAGTERYVAEVASRTAERGHEVHVLGGDPAVMPSAVFPASCRPAPTLYAALRSLASMGRPDLVHAHLTLAETAAFLASPVHRAPVITTRHIAAQRGSSSGARMFSRVLNRFLALQIAISQHVGASIETPPDIVLRHGVAVRNGGLDPAARVVLAIQRLESEKDPATAIRAWAASGLDASGWQLRLAGEGSQREDLLRLVDRLGLTNVVFLGNVDDVPGELAASAIVLAASAQEGLGLAVLEAMAAGRPVVATEVGGHRETLPPRYPFFFPVGDDLRAGDLLRQLSQDAELRTSVGGELRARQRAHFDVECHVDRLLDLYSEAALRGPRPYSRRRVRAEIR